MRVSSNLSPTLSRLVRLVWAECGAYLSHFVHVRVLFEGLRSLITGKGFISMACHSRVALSRRFLLG